VRFSAPASEGQRLVRDTAGAEIRYEAGETRASLLKRASKDEPKQMFVGTVGRKRRQCLAERAPVASSARSSCGG
jgi:hypothetical protein